MQLKRHFFPTYTFIILCNFVFIVLSCSNSDIVVADKIDGFLEKSSDMIPTQPDSAIIFANKVLAMCGTAFPEKRAVAHKQVGVACIYKKEYEAAHIAFDKALKIQMETGDKAAQISSCNYIGTLHQIQQAEDKAIKCFFNSLDIAGTMDTIPIELIDTRLRLGSIFSHMKNFEKAAGHYDQALDLCEKHKDTIRIAATYQYKGNSCFRMDSLDAALKSYKKAKPFYEAKKDTLNLVTIYNNIGGIHATKRNYDDAIYNYDKSLRLKKGLADSSGVANTAYNFCELSYDFGKYQQAIKYCNTSIEYAQSLGKIEVLANAHYKLYEIEKQQKNNSKALLHFETYAIWNDSLDSNTKEVEIRKIINEHEKNIELTSLQDKHHEQRILYLLAILLTLITICGLIFYSRSKKKLHREEQKLRLQEEQLRLQEEQLRKETEGRRIEEGKLYNQVIKTLEKDAEIKAVNAEIDAKLKERTKVASTLHDSVCSGLVSARMHMESVKNNITPEDKAVFAKGFGLLNEAYEICREISHDLSPPMLAKFGLAPAIEGLCEKLSTPQTQLHFNATPFEERLDHQQELTLYQSIQELLQNILKHSSAAEAHVQLTDYGDSLNILVEDDGKGFDTAEISDGGIGLQRIRTRVKHLGGSMDVDSSPGNGTTVIIDVPKLLISQNGSIS